MLAGTPETLRGTVYVPEYRLPDAMVKEETELHSTTLLQTLPSSERSSVTFAGNGVANRRPPKSMPRKGLVTVTVVPGVVVIVVAVDVVAVVNFFVILVTRRVVVVHEPE